MQYHRVFAGPALLKNINLLKILAAPALRYVQGKKDKSCKLLCGGERVGDKGFYFQPTAFEVTDNNAKIAQEEIFGPVQCIFKWNDTNEVCCGGLGGLRKQI
jgi:acyl-CoA reductase-like NAD-dependent aldehyde dehydrogenase